MPFRKSKKRTLVDALIGATKPPKKSRKKKLLGLGAGTALLVGGLSALTKKDRNP